MVKKEGLGLPDKIWNEIKDVEINLFALPKKIEDCCSPRPFEPSKLYLAYTVGAVLPAVEEALKKKYIVELSDKYITVSYKV